MKQFIASITFVFVSSFGLLVADDDRPNIILIMVDDMGWSDIGCYGSEIETPNIDRLANEGMLFTQFYNNAKCTTTRASIIAGRYPRRGAGNRFREFLDPAEPTLAALRRGLHVLCEKPIALAEAEIDGLITARDAADKFAAEAFMVTHHPQWRRARDLIAEGASGDLRHVQGAFSFFNTDPDNIRNRADQAGGALRDIGVYPSDVNRFVTGAEPETIRAEIDWDEGIDATARIWATFPEFTMDFYVSMRMAPRQQMVFHGTTGFLTVEPRHG